MRLLLLLVALGATSAAARTVDEKFELQATVRTNYGKPVTHAFRVVVFRDDALARAPFLILNHGRAARDEDRAKLGEARYTDNSRYFVSKGFAVFVPTRIGYGVTGGEDVEYTGTCSVRNYPPGYEAAAEQTRVLIEHARKLPYVDGERGLVVGQSFGGATAITLAAKPPPGVLGAVNLAGGGGGDPVGRPGNPCRPDLLEAMFAGYGETARIPTLWIYTENDKYFGKDLPPAWFAAFRKKGGNGEFVQLPPLDPALGDDGHATFTRNPSAWRPHFEAFLKRVGF